MRVFFFCLLQYYDRHLCFILTFLARALRSISIYKLYINGKPISKRNELWPMTPPRLGDVRHGRSTKTGRTGFATLSNTWKRTCAGSPPGVVGTECLRLGLSPISKVCWRARNHLSSGGDDGVVNFNSRVIHASFFL